MEEYRIIGIVGRRGAGKTLYGVYLLDEYSKMGKTIYSNIWLKIPHKELDLSMLDTLPEELNNSVIFIDEIQQWADAYKFFSKDSVALSTLATQLRKRKIHLIFTTQFLKQTVVRLRDQTDYIVVMNKLGKVQGFSKATVLDATAPTGNDYIGEFYFDGRRYFNKYDTNQVVLGRN